MAFHGERFNLDLEDDAAIPSDPAPSPFDLIGEIKERAPTAAHPPAPTPPTPTASSTGFPAHRRRNKPSSFKQRRAEQATTPQDAPTASVPPTLQDDKKSIGEENTRHLASMSEAQIEKEREELMASLDPGLLERFLRRAKIDEEEKSGNSTTTPAPAPISTPTPAKATVEDEEEEEPISKPKKSVSFNLPPKQPEITPKQPQYNPNAMPKLPPGHDDLAPTNVPKDLHPASEYPNMDPSTIDHFHFPQPTQKMPTLDPNSPNFLTDLKTHYFPEITHNPSSLSWLQPPSSSPEDPESESAYHPSSSAISMAPSSIRFSLRGTILAPTTSLALPTTLGLHHHGDDPQAAGYTIPELAILSRSTFPAQRCVAWQVLGRILFRLGRAEFGERGGQLSEGLWFCIEKEGVVAGMLSEADGAGDSGNFGKIKTDGKEEKKDGENGMPVASGIGRHASATAWAVEGVWLWQQGGAGDRGLLREGQHRSQ